MPQNQSMTMHDQPPVELDTEFNPEDKAFGEMSAPIDNNTPYVSKRRGQKTKEKESLMM